MLVGQDPDTQTLPTDGVYTVMIEGDVGQTAAAPYSFTVFPVSVAARTLSLGQTVTGALATPGAQDRYDFHLDAPTQALFASLVNRSDATWTLTGAKGEIVSRRALSASTSNAGDPTLPLGPGDYILTIAGVNSATGAYGFQLLQLSGATPATLSADVTGTLDDGGLTATAAHVDGGAAIANAANGKALSLGLNGAFGGIGDPAAPHNDNLTVKGWARLGYNAGVPGVIFQDGNTWAGYSLRVDNNGRLQFILDGDALTAPGYFTQGRWTHIAATYDGANMQLYADGVEIAANKGEALGARAGLVGLWHLTETSGLTLTDASGAGFDATLPTIPGVGAKLLSFNLVAGQSYLLFNNASSQPITARIYNPNGLMVAAQPLASILSFTPDVSGVYTLALQGAIGNGDSASYDVSLIPSTTATASLAVGAVADGSTGLPGQSVAYTINVSADTKLIFDALSAEPGLKWSLTGPEGPLVLDRTFEASDGINGPVRPLIDAPAGVYTLTVSGGGAAAGAFRFRLLDAGAASAFNLGDDVTATPDFAGGMALYRLQRSAGDVVSFSVAANSGASWELLDPYGRPVFLPSGATTQTGLKLGADGGYLLLVQGALNQTTPPTLMFSAKLDSHEAPSALTATALTLGAPVSGNFAGSGE
jgi:large repetitive protein